MNSSGDRQLHIRRDAKLEGVVAHVTIDNAGKPFATSGAATHYSSTFVAGAKYAIPGMTWHQPNERYEPVTVRSSDQLAGLCGTTA